MRFLPPIRIHIWGGLGSQLYAWALYIDLSERLPHRRLHLIFHNGGVTKRDPDIAQFFKADAVKVVLDFSNKSQETGRKSSGFKAPILGKSILARILTFLGFLSNCDESRSFNKLKPWVLEVRGHYSYRRIKQSTAQKIYRQLIDGNQTDSVDPYIGVHDRLGDLMSLASKGPTPVDSLLSEMQKGIQRNPTLNVKVFSDSIEEAKKRLMPLGNLAEIEYCDLNPTLTILALINSEYFVGTSSKISLWVVIFRSFLHPENISVMPSNLENNLVSNIGTRANISCY